MIKDHTYSLVIASLLLLLFMVGCGKPNDKNKTQIDEIKVEIAEVKTDTTHFEHLAWETKKVEARDWSMMVYSVVENEEPQMLNDDAAEDIKLFCPRYKSLSNAERLNFWGQFFSALAEPESGWDPNNTTVETDKNFKKMDAVTNQRVRSEGLLQLSYQDEKSHHLNCGFNWKRDQNLAAEDSRKSIFHPYLNLRCGIKIMANQLKKRKSITLKNDVYWSVLRTTDHEDTIKAIAGRTKSLRICQ